MNPLTRPAKFNKSEIIDSYYGIRKLIGILGIILPVILLIVHKKELNSISHYYYTDGAIFFIGILVTLGLFLISYKGYERDPETELLSDNVITNIGGYALLLVVLIPTCCDNSLDPEILDFCSQQIYPLWGHNNNLYGTWHLIFAAIFLVCMGAVSFFRFTKGSMTPVKEVENLIYRLCAMIIWACLLFLGYEMMFLDNLPDYHIFRAEFIAVVAFGISWLIKGETIKNLIKDDAENNNKNI